MPVRQLRLVVTAPDYEEALRFYRDVLGLTQRGGFSSPDGRVAILAAGHATLELADPAHAAFIDEVEVGHEAAGKYRVAFELDDVVAGTAALTAAGASVVADPIRTPWDSLNSRLDAPGGLHLTLFQELAGSSTMDTLWLDELASGAATPGGGAAAAMNVAIGAALVAMVCHLTIGKPRYAAGEDIMKGALAEATALRAEAVRLAAEDEAAFGAVTAAYRLPRDSPARPGAIQAALSGAAEVPLRTADAATAVIDLARRILDSANVSVLSDVAVAAASASAGFQAATVNVAVNLAALEPGERRDELGVRLASTTDAASAADSIVREVRRRIAP